MVNEIWHGVLRTFELFRNCEKILEHVKMLFFHMALQNLKLRISMESSPSQVDVHLGVLMVSHTDHHQEKQRHHFPEVRAQQDLQHFRTSRTIQSPQQHKRCLLVLASAGVASRLQTHEQAADACRCCSTVPGMGKILGISINGWVPFIIHP